MINKKITMMITMAHGTIMTMINDNNDDTVQLLAQQRSATAQSKAHRRGAPFYLRFSCGDFGSEGRFLRKKT